MVMKAIRLLPSTNGVIFCQPKCIGCSKLRHIGLFVAPFVDGTFERGAEHSFVAQAGCATEATQCRLWIAMACS